MAKMQMLELPRKDLVLRLEKIRNEIGDLIEELEILSDEELMKDLEESVKDFEGGRYYTFEDILDLHKRLETF
jgi:hypothetical protein